MKITSRAAIVAAFCVGPVLLAAGCGGTGDAGGPSETLVKIQPTSFVEVAPATTETTTTVPVDTTPGKSPGEQTYTVQSGDGASLIASKHDITLEQLVNYNDWPEGTSHKFFVGDVVKIPPGASVPGETQTADPGGGTGGTESADTGGDTGTVTEDTSGDQVAGEGCPTTYVIKEGDNTRIGVADQFGITYQQMDAANAGTPGYSSFLVGTEIQIPCP